MNWYKVSQFGSIPTKIIPPRENINKILSGCFNYGVIIGPQMANTNELTGGVELSDPEESARVDNLVKAISSPGGYFERILVSADGDVIEGQHRFEAAKKMGWPQIPIFRVADFSHIYNTDAMHRAAMNVGKMNHDRAFYLVRQAIDTIQKAGSPEKALSMYQMPPELEPAWQAVMQAAISSKRQWGQS